MHMRSIEEFNRRQKEKESYEDSPFSRVRVCLWCFAAILLPGIADWLGCVFIAVFQGIFGSDDQYREALREVSWDSFTAFYRLLWELCRLALR